MILTNVNIELTSPTAIMPTQAHPGDAGLDLYADLGGGQKYIVIQPQTNELIDVGFKIAIPDGYFGAIYARSGLAAKEGLRPSNTTGIVDSQYRGNVKVSLYNDSKDFARVITHGQRIAQMIIQPYLKCELKMVDRVDDTERGDGGFGSSGK